MLPEEDYDAIVLGTGLKECIIVGLLTQQGKRVLQLDRNAYYGGEGAALLQPAMFEKFLASDRASRYGTCDVFIDLIPKLILARGKFSKMLRHTKLIQEYGDVMNGDIAGSEDDLKFERIAGSYFSIDSTSILKVPADDKEMLASSVMGIFEKRRYKNFFLFAAAYDPTDPTTHEGRDLTQLTMRELYVQFGLSPKTQQFVSCAIALASSGEAHMDLPAAPTVANFRNWFQSCGGPSSFVYPTCSLGKLPEKLAMISAAQGPACTMLGQDVDEILMNDNGEACGIRSGNRKATAQMVIGDPSYFPTNKVRSTGKVVRCICLLMHPIGKTGNTPTYQIILRGADIGRANDVHICCNGIAPRAFYYAVVSTVVESSDPEEDLKAGLAFLQPIEEKFISVVDFMEPVEDGLADKCFISKSLDATSHLESDCDDVLSLYKRATGENLDMDIIPASAKINVNNMTCVVL